MKIVVTGALGHIGSSLIRGLPKAFPRADIVLVDNMSTQRFCSLFDLPKAGRYRFVQDDVMTADLRTLFDGADIVVHLAAITDAESSFSKKDLVEQVNFEGLKRVADACRAAGSALIFPSTTSVYGVQKTLVSEDCGEGDLKPQSPYAESKRHAEKFLQSTGAESGLKFVILRLGTIFGASAGMRFHTAVNKFCWQAVLGQPITVWRTALNQKRPYLYLGDAVNALTFVSEKRHFDGGIYNVLTVNATVGEIVEALKEEIPDVGVSLVDSAIMNQLSYEVDSSKFRRLGFRFKGKMREGIRETLRLLRGARFRGGA